MRFLRYEHFFAPRLAMRNGDNMMDYALLTGLLPSRAGQNFQGLNFQTPPRNLAQNMNAYQVWGP